MHQPDYQGALRYARRRLEQELAPELAYHNVDHTFGPEGVVPVVLQLADSTGISEHDAQLVAVAAAFHDIGWLVQSHDHELASVSIARSVLPQMSFSGAQLAAIAGMILATRLPQSPANVLEELVADADQATLGSPTFWPRLAALRAEFTYRGHAMSDAQWYRSQLQFLETHHYFTAAARARWDAQKQMYLIEIRRRLQALSE